MQDSVVEDIINQLFPAKALPLKSPEKASPEELFLVISSSQTPRWIIPYLSAYGLPVLHQWRPYGASSSLKWAVLKWAYGLGQLHRLPTVTLIGVQGANSQDWSHLGQTTVTPLAPVIYVGTPGSTRKAVVTLVGKLDRQMVGVAKLPLGDLAKTSILHEAEMLERLSLEKPGLAPQCLFVDSEKGIMVQEALSGRPVARELTSAHVQWLLKLHQKSEKTSIRAQSETLVQRLRTIGEVGKGDRTEIERALQMLSDATPIPMTWIHGDFAPWNLKWDKDHRALVAVDWEDAKPGGLPLYDLFHYQYMQAHLFGTARPILTNTWESSVVSQYVQSLKLTRSQFDQIALHYLLDMWLQSLQRGKNSDAQFYRREALSLVDLSFKEGL